MNTRALLRRCLHALKAARLEQHENVKQLAVWRLVAKGSQDGLWWYDCATRQLWGSSRWWAGMGYRYDERTVHQKVWHTWIHPADLDSVIEAHQFYLNADPSKEPIQYRYRLRNLKGRYHWRSDYALGCWDEAGKPLYLAGSSRDLTDANTDSAEALQRLYNDSLTQLFNRHYFIRHIKRFLIDESCRQELRALFLVDVDRFQSLNANLGHQIGDLLLVQIAKRLQSICQDGDLLARLGGDEFAILSDALSNPEQAFTFARALQKAFTAPFKQEERWISLTVGIGLALNKSIDTQQPAYRETTAWLRDADLALNQAKAQGRGEWVCFEPTLQRRRAERMKLENELKHAIRNNELRLHFQPIVELKTGICHSVEALIRWQHPERGLLTPGAFIPFAEEAGLLPAIGDWVLVQACRELAAIGCNTSTQRKFVVAVNIAGPQFADLTICQRIAELLEQWKVNPASLRLEITETLIANSADWVSQQLNNLRALGISTAIDDFGTGHSSLARLIELPFDFLKFDAFFLRKIDDPRCRVLLEGIVNITKRLNLPTVIEGIENPQQHLLVSHLGCDYGQGFLFSRPQPDLAKIVASLKQSRY